jgi:transcription antitermination factor NusG
MPLLAKEVYTWPVDLLASFPPDSADPEDFAADQPWWALYTFARREKALMRKLLADDQQFCCPVACKTHRTAAGTVRRAYVPVFSNYVFLRGDDAARYQAVCTGDVSRYLPVPDPRRFAAQLGDIVRLIESGQPVTVEARLPRGTEVRVKSGPFKGMLGRITQVRKHPKFTVYLDFMQQGVSLAVDDWEIERV